jgi:hypothetical protein
MNASRSPRATYVAAFLLGALIALLLLTPARAADPFRLDRIGIVQFSPVGADRLLRRNGVMLLNGEIQWRGSSELARPANTPDYALNRPLLTSAALQAYLALGSFSLQGFMLQEGGVTLYIGDDTFKAVTATPTEDNYIWNGALINISTRATLAATGDEVVAGFVVETRPRAVLVRVVGPSLIKFGIGNPAPTPQLTLRQGGQVLAVNDQWSAEGQAELIAAAAAHVGAFPLDAGSRDAARVVILAPGAYTLHAGLAPGSTRPGMVLVEVYALPDDAIYESAAAKS